MEQKYTKEQMFEFASIVLLEQLKSVNADLESCYKIFTLKNNNDKTPVKNLVYSCGEPCPYVGGGSYHKCKECTEHE